MTLFLRQKLVLKKEMLKNGQITAYNLIHNLLFVFLTHTILTQAYFFNILLEISINYPEMVLKWQINGGP